MATPMFCRMMLVCTIIGGIQAAPNTYWSKRSGEQEGNSIHPIGSEKPQDLIEEIANIHCLPFPQLLAEKKLRREKKLLFNNPNLKISLSFSFSAL